MTRDLKQTKEQFLPDRRIFFSFRCVCAWRCKWSCGGLTARDDKLLRKVSKLWLGSASTCRSSLGPGNIIKNFVLTSFNCIILQNIGLICAVIFTFFIPKASKWQLLKFDNLSSGLLTSWLKNCFRWSTLEWCHLQFVIYLSVIPELYRLQSLYEGISRLYI